MVVDASALLAVMFAEPTASWVAARLEAHKAELSMSTVNLAEVLIRARDRFPDAPPRLEREILGSGIHFVPPTVEQARCAAEARLKFPLNLGDCFAYALAVDRAAPLLTCDRDFRNTGIPLCEPPA